MSLKLPAGYRLEWGSQYETLHEATQLLTGLIPIVMLIILGVLYLAFGCLRPALVILTRVPFACVGGVVTLSLCGMPLSLAAAVGFIALSGVAVLKKRTTRFASCIRV